MTSRWSEADLRRVLTHHTNAEAGRILGISRERARQIRERLGVPTPEPTRRRDRRVAALIQRGVPTTQVASAVGLDPSTVRRIAHRLGVTPPPPPPPPHGTRAGYLRHLRRGEPACEPCLAANREAARQAAKKRTVEPDTSATLPSAP